MLFKKAQKMSITFIVVIILSILLGLAFLYAIGRLNGWFAP
jgi:CHASE3 domain sensor protein